MSISRLDFAASLCAAVHIALTIPIPARADDAETPVIFGVLEVLSGGLAYLGNDCRSGMALAESDINAAGGIRGRRLVVRWEDFGPMDLKKAAVAAGKFTSIDHVAAMFSATLEDTEVVAPIAERARVPLMASHPGGVNVGRFGKYVFRATNSDSTLIELMLNYAFSKSNGAVCMVHNDTAYFESFAAASNEYAESRGRKLERIRISADPTEAGPAALRAKSLGCAEVIAITMPAQFVPLIKRLREIGSKATIIGPGYIKYDSVSVELGGNGGEILFGRFDPPTEAFVRHYREYAHAEPPPFTANCYDAISVMAHAMNKVGLDFDAVNAELRAMKDFPGASGLFTVGANGDRYGQTASLFRVTATGAEKL